MQPRHSKRAGRVAAQWRETRPDLARRGVVVVNKHGQACGWMDRLRDPEGWEPGCWAVDTKGRQWQAMGGDDYNGASRWVPVTEQTTGRRWAAPALQEARA
ncbi:MAG: hypothetical protein CME38_18880 [Haliea sp.]|nr:hypothetical protein [Haliea sp.]